MRVVVYCPHSCLRCKKFRGIRNRLFFFGRCGIMRIYGRKGGEKRGVFNRD